MDYEALLPTAEDRAPWLKAEYLDPEGRRWKELSLPQLVLQPEFLNVAA